MTERGYRHARTDYPKGVVAVYDNGGKTFDRYTVVYEPFPLPTYRNALHDAGTPVFSYVGMSDSPFHPLGFCQHGETVGYRPTGGWGSALGRVIKFEELLADCQRAVRRDLEEEAAARGGS